MFHRHGCTLSVSDDEEVLARVEGSVKVLQDFLSKGCFVYGNVIDRYLQSGAGANDPQVSTQDLVEAPIPAPKTC